MEGVMKKRPSVSPQRRFGIHAYNELHDRFNNLEYEFGEKFRMEREQLDKRVAALEHTLHSQEGMILDLTGRIARIERGERLKEENNVRAATEAGPGPTA
jgi:hypothetical protein